MRFLFLIGIFIISNLFPVEKEYNFNTLVEFKSIETNKSHIFLFNDFTDDYYLTIYNDYNNKIKVVIRDKKSFKKHHLEVLDFTQNLEYNRSEEYLPEEKNKTFTEYYFEVVEKEIDSSFKILNIFKFKNTKRKKLKNAIDLIHEHSNIIVDERFLNHFCHGYFSNTDFKFSFPLPKKIIVYKNNNTTETFQLSKLEKIDLKINFTEQ